MHENKHVDNGDLRVNIRQLNSHCVVSGYKGSGTFMVKQSVELVTLLYPLSMSAVTSDHNIGKQTVTVVSFPACFDYYNLFHTPCGEKCFERLWRSVTEF